MPRLANAPVKGMSNKQRETELKKSIMESEVAEITVISFTWRPPKALVDGGVLLAVKWHLCSHFSAFL